MPTPSPSRESQSQNERLLDQSGRIWFACVGLFFILGSLAIKELNTLMFLVGSLFALLSFNGARLSGITLGKDKLSAETALQNRVFELGKENTTRITIGADANISQELLRELTEPLKVGIQTEGCGLAKIIRVDDQTKTEILRQMSISSGIISLPERSIVGIGRVQDSQPSGKLLALMDDGSDYIVDYPNSLTEPIPKASTDAANGDTTRQSSLTGAIHEDRNN